MLVPLHPGFRGCEYLGKRGVSLDGRGCTSAGCVSCQKTDKQSPAGKLAGARQRQYPPSCKAKGVQWPLAGVSKQAAGSGPRGQWVQLAHRVAELGGWQRGQAWLGPFTLTNTYPRTHPPHAHAVICTHTHLSSAHTVTSTHTPFSC